jgi:hypothetical protein
MRPRFPALATAILAATIVSRTAPAAVLSTHAQTMLADAHAWSARSVAAIGHVRAGATGLESAGNILALYYDASGAEPLLRVSLVAPVGIADRQPVFANAGVRVAVLLDEGAGANTELPAPLSGPAPFAWDRVVVIEPSSGAASVATSPKAANRVQAALADHLDRGWLASALPAVASTARRACVLTYTPDGRELDRLVTPLSPDGGAAYTTNVAFAHHGNQGLAYSNAFTGRSGSESTSGFDEVLRIHEADNIPGNFHLSALDQTSAEWNHQNGDPLDFNGWLRTGVTNGWADMLTSAYGQPIMPFLQGAMNDWAIGRDVGMVSTRYNYTPHVAWVPERTFLDPSTYPNGGVIDWTGAHWQSHGVNGVILDDSPHCNGHNNHQIHFLQGNGLRLIPRDANFTGKLHSGDGSGALAVLTDEANSGNGQYRITVYADDWEMAAAVGGWETTFPYAYGTYQWMIDKCSTESAWLHTWKLDAALNNPDFNGDTFTPTYGTYGGIGDVQGYGGNNNAWYSDWAGYVPYSTGGNGSGACGGPGSCKNHGQLWNDAHAALEAAPDNKIRETGWYVLMSNLHETGWHDYLGGPLSGWERQYSAHIKNALPYAEAARWAGGQYANATGCFLTDIDDDGQNELVIYNERVFAVFESIGGRCTQLFAKGSDYAYSVVGIDNAYWAGTEGDYNDVNHVAALSDVGPNYQNDFYTMHVDTSSGSTVQASFTHSGVTKIVKLSSGQPYLNCVYKVGGATQYIQSGFSPDVVDLLFNAHMDRIWGGSGTSYMGQRDPNTGATAAYVLGGGGASHNLNFQTTLSKVDEIKGTEKFQFYLYAGYASAPDSNGHVAELESLASGLTDQLPPEAVSGTYFPATHQLALTFDEPVQAGNVVVTGIKIDANNDGAADVTLDGGCTVLTSGNAATITIQCSNAVNTAITGLTNKNAMKLMLDAGAVRDVAGNLVAALTNSDNVPVSYGPPTLITLDGRFDPSEWPGCTVAVADSFDSAWNAGPNNITNEIQALYATWDSTYLYLGIRGIVTSNSWLLYLDTDPGGPNGQTDLTNINAWARHATFTAPGFKPDWEFGAYQHQGQYDSQSFFKILSATTTANYSDSILKAFDPGHSFGLNGGSEIAIPWSVLYGLGPGHVPANAQIGLVASLCWDPEPNGQLGGDQAPNNLSATAPAIDNRVLVTIDANGDGIPDAIDRTPPSLLSASPSGYDSVVVLSFSEPLLASTANQPSRYSVYQTGSPTSTLTIKSATLQPGNTQVRLVVSHMSYVPYTATASGIADASCFQNVTGGTSAAFQGPPVSVDPATGLPRALALAAPWPNPSRDGSVMLAYDLPGGDGAGRPVVLALYDLVGRRVRTLVQGAQAPGSYRVALDGRDERGTRLAPGLYFVRLSRGASQQARRLVVMP